jgi:microsomal epoxide hydrolase/non-specific protein-tyrosine kinase
MIMAARDVALPPSAAEGIEKYVPNVTKYLVEDSGHWTQQEQPQEVNEVMIEWLSRRFWS